MAILSLLAALSLSSVSRFRSQSEVQKARIEMVRIVTAITQYEAAYGRYPVSSEASRAADLFNEDMTYGGVLKETGTWVAGPGYLTDNAELMAPLLDLDFYGDGVPTINWGHLRNPQQIRFLEASLAPGTNAPPGLGLDGQYRDPWGSPYVITLDLNHDGRTRDAMYHNPAVSEDPARPGTGLYGLSKGVDSQGRPVFEATTAVMIWSSGPDRHLDTTQKANTGVNRDNVLSWYH
jgi:hypothetical protein